MGTRAVPARLAGMMFVYFFGLGSWVVTLSTYLMSAPTAGGLNLSTAEVGWVYSTFAFGGMLAPLVIGVLTDRLFRAEVVLGVACLVAAGLLVAAGRWCETSFREVDAAYRAAAARELAGGDGPLALARANDDPAVRRAAAATAGPLVGIMLAYCVCGQLALTLTTVITLRNLPDPGRDFARVRLFGTLGWIAAGNAVGLVLPGASAGVLYLAAAATGAAGVYAFTLPPTPPMGTGRSVAEAFGLPALRLFKDRSFVVFVLVAFAATTTNQFYVVYGHRLLTDLGVPRPVQVMTVAQVVELGCMVALPLLRPKDWMKPLMAVGLLGYAVRGVVMAVGWAPAVVVLGVPMHGVGYALFFLVGATYLDREAPPHLRASAQGIITFVSGGIGVWVGNEFVAAVVDRHRVGTVIDWRGVWEVPLVVCAVLLVVFVALFHPPMDEAEKANGREEARKATKS